MLIFVVSLHYLIGLYPRASAEIIFREGPIETPIPRNSTNKPLPLFYQWRVRSRTGSPQGNAASSAPRKKRRPNYIRNPISEKMPTFLKKF